MATAVARGRGSRRRHAVPRSPIPAPCGAASTPSPAALYGKGPAGQRDTQAVRDAEMQRDTGCAIEEEAWRMPVTRTTRGLMAGYVVLVAGATAVCLTLPRAHAPLWAVIGLAGVVAVLTGVYVHRPADPGAARHQHRLPAR